MLASTENRRKALMVRFLVSTEPFSAEVLYTDGIVAVINVRNSEQLVNSQNATYVGVCGKPHPKIPPKRGRLASSSRSGRSGR
jgi:hypothetical protein